jgi:hypothetical protein
MVAAGAGGNFLFTGGDFGVGHYTQFVSGASSTMVSFDGDAASNLARSLTSARSSNYTNATASFTTVATAALTVGAWSCHAQGTATDSTIADGVQINMIWGGTATGVDAVTVSTQGVATVSKNVDTAIAGTSTTVASTSTGTWWIEYDFQPNVTVAGTLTFQAAQSAHTTGTLTIQSGFAVNCARL